MSIRPLRYLGDPILRTASDPVTRFDQALAVLIEDLLDTVREPGRAGLAANQIGSGLAAFSYNVDGQFGYLINPRSDPAIRRPGRRGGLPVDTGRERVPAPARVGDSNRRQPGPGTGRRRRDR